MYNHIQTSAHGIKEYVCTAKQPQVLLRCFKVVIRLLNFSALYKKVIAKLS
jgi:hypothetical protein